MNMIQNLAQMRTRRTAREIVWLVTFYLLLWQSALQQISSIFGYIDETVAMMGIVVVTYYSFSTRRLVLKRSSVHMIVVFFFFLTSGLLGNVIFRYQPIQYVLVDVYANMKFFLSIISGYALFRNSTEETKKMAAKHARFSAVCFFLMLLADQLFHVFSSPGSRYGLRVSQLTHSHATYLAGSMIFLLSVLTAFYDRRNNLPIIMSLTVLFFTLRGKSIAGIVVYVFLVYFVLMRKKKLRLWHILLGGLGVAAVGWDLIMYYYVDLRGRSARSVLTETAFKIMRDYFPIGTGFGTYASASAGQHYSPVYVKYGFRSVYELGGNETGWGYFSDTFWPIIIGQTGFIGTVFYGVMLILLFRRMLKVRKKSNYAYFTAVFSFAYILISSTSEPAFNNSSIIPLALLIGYIFSLEDQKVEEPATDSA